MKLPSLITICLSLSIAGVSLARAHAFLDRAEPRVGATLAISPTQVKLWMTEDLEPAFSHLQVFDASGKEVDGKDIQVSGATMLVSLPVNLAGGSYRVSWVAVAVDTHKTSGTFSFNVR